MTLKKSFPLPFSCTKFSLKSLLCSVAAFWVIVLLAGEPLVQSEVLSALNQVFVLLFYFCLALTSLPLPIARSESCDRTTY